MGRSGAIFGLSVVTGEQWLAAYAPKKVGSVTAKQRSYMVGSMVPHKGSMPRRGSGCRHGSTDVAASAFAETKPPANRRAIG